MKFLNLIFFSIFFSAISYGQCKIIYVTTTGSGSGTKASPNSLTNAITIATKKDVIKLGNGTYNIDNPINLIDSITFEGGFLPASNWIKSSLAGTTVINRTTFNSEGIANQRRLVAFYGNSVTGFRFQDITITTANGNETGMSTYGLHLNNCTNYNLVRCRLGAGSAGSGAGDDNPATYNSTWDGQAGTIGALGAYGTKGDQTGVICSNDAAGIGGAGGTGGAGGLNATSIGGSGAAGTNGGAGGNGSSDNPCGNGLSGSAGVGGGGNAGAGGASDGNNADTPFGGNGGNGFGGSVGTNGTTVASTFSGVGFYVPSFGTNGTAGTGGRGGGGSGGSGGSGGGGAGSGAFGGGSAFGLFIWNGGVGAQLIDCDFIQGAAGAQGFGGSGGSGGISQPGRGVTTGAPCISGDSDCNRGGAGGAGGKGGNADAGVSFGVYVNGTTPALIQNSTLIVLVTGGSNPANFNLGTQPEIKFDHQICANSASSFTAATSSTWLFGAAASPTSAVGSVVTTTYQTIGWNNLTFNSNLYSGFVYVSPFSVSNSNAGVDQNVCATTATLNGNVPTYGIGSWTSLGTASVTTPSLSSSTVTGLVSGSNKFVWTISNGGCCASSASTVDIIYSPISLTVNSGVICTGLTFTIIPSGGVSYTYSSGSNTVSPTLNTNYTVIGTSAGGCTNTAVCSVTVNPIPSLTITSSSNSICSGTTITLTPSGAVNYTLNPGALSGIGNFTLSPTSTTQYTLTGDDGLCSATVFPVAHVSVTPSSISPTLTKTDVLCNGNSTGSLTVTVGGGPFTYSLFPGGAATTATISGLTAGNYSVVVGNSCSSVTVTANIAQPMSALATATAVNNVLCNGGATGAATVTASGGTSPYTYLWSGAQTTSVTSGQTSGVRTVTVTDANSCITTNTVTITQPTSALGTTTAVTNVLCFGNTTGSATITASGGTAPYTYLWSGAQTTSVISGQPSGAYTATVTDANSCTSINGVIVTQPSALAATITSTTTDCVINNGAAAVVVSGGTGAYTYSWTPNGGTAATASSLGIGTYSCLILDANLCALTKTISIITSGAPTATVTSTSNVTCNGSCNGSATITAIGGVTPYTYLWSNGNTVAMPTGFCAGVYNCTVTGNNGCSVVVGTAITQPVALTANATSSSILCYGGMSNVTITATGGTIPYTGVGTFTAIAGTKTYTVTDANGCSTTTSITITEPTVINASSSSSAILCNGGVSTITVSAIDGTAPYTGTGTFTMNAGTNTYTVTDNNGCLATTSITVIEPTVLNVSSLISSSAICVGDIATVTVTAVDGTAPYIGTGTYTINSADTYTVTDANGCNATTHVSLTVNALPTVSATTNNTLICTGETATLTANGATTYTWNTSETTNDIAVSPTVTTTFTVNGTDANGCSNSTTIVQDVSLCTGINSSIVNQNSEIVLYPNPNNGLFVIEVNSTTHIELVDVLGKTILKQQLEVGKCDINITDYANGVYFIKTNNVYTHKLVKQN